jgi:hypothetical protein
MNNNQTPSVAARETTAAFTIDMQPAAPDLEMTDRNDFTKLWTGGMSGASSGLMLSAGDPARGKAGYVALERFDGTIDGLRGTVALQQYGSMNDGVTLYYEFVPGSGTDGLSGITGAIDLTVTEGDHRVHVRYALN